MRHSRPLAPIAALLLAAATLAPAPAAAGEVLDRILAEKTIRLGVRTDAPPFAATVDGRPQGFTVDLCGLMAGAILATSKIDELSGTFVSVDAEDRFDALAEGRIDVLCGATTATLERRETMSFTIATFATGVGALVSADAPELLREVLVSGGPAALSGAAVREALGGKRLGVRKGTTAERWLGDGPIAKIEGVEIVGITHHEEGIAGVAEGNLDVYFADKAILAGLMAGAEDRDRFAVSRNTFTYEPYALAIPRGDEELRLVMDRALSHIYRKGAILDIYERHFGAAGPDQALFYGLSALPE